jgi:hypothetical protein
VVIFFTGCKSEVNSNNINVKNGRIYVDDSNKPFTGKVRYDRAIKDIVDGEVIKEVQFFTTPDLNKIEKIASYNQGKLNGEYSEWYRSGNKKFALNYKDGSLTGRVQQWDDRGEVYCDFTIDDNSIFTHYNFNGRKALYMKAYVLPFETLISLINKEITVANQYFGEPTAIENIKGDIFYKWSFLKIDERSDFEKLSISLIKPSKHNFVKVCLISYYTPSAAQNEMLKSAFDEFLKKHSDTRYDKNY